MLQATLQAYCCRPIVAGLLLQAYDAGLLLQATSASFFTQLSIILSAFHSNLQQQQQE